MKFIFITGVSTGIGYTLAKLLIQRSYFVIGTVRNQVDKEKLESDFGKNFKCLIMDVTDQISIAKCYEETKESLKGANLTGLVNNAGIAVPGPMIDLSIEAFEKQMNVNVSGVFRVTKLFVSLLKSKDNNIETAGRLINISSISGLLNTPFLGAYCVSKHAVESISDIYRRELNIFGIKVIIIEPGPIKSDIWKKSLNSMDKFKDSDYWPYLKESNKVVSSTEKHALESEYLADIIIKAIESKRPKLRYIVHKQGWLIYLVHHLLPTRWMDGITRNKLRKMIAGSVIKRY